MKVRRSTGVVSLVATLGMVGAAAVPSASATGSGSADVRVVTRGLDGPFGLQKAVRHRGFVVAESVSGEVTRVFKSGRQRVIVAGAAGVAGVATSPRRVFAVLGGESEAGPPPGSKYPPSSLLRTNYRGHHVKVIADLAQYELDNNPDGQVQFVNGSPVDALSNPFSMTRSKFGLFVADGGANDVLKVNPRTGRISTFFVPPTVKDVPACLDPANQANPGTVGCDPVPTGVDVVNGSVYVSTLGAEVPGAGRVYRLSRTGKVQRVWKGLTSPTGIAVRRDGTIYVSHVLASRITKISHGRRTHAQVTMPTGLELAQGDLYSSAGSIAGPGAGQVVKVKERAFR